MTAAFTHHPPGALDAVFFGSVSLRALPTFDLKYCELQSDQSALQFNE